MKVKTKKKIKSALYRAARTFFQAFIAVVTAGPLLDLGVSTLKAGAVAGLASLLSLIQRALDDTNVPTIPPG